MGVLRSAYGQYCQSKGLSMVDEMETRHVLLPTFLDRFNLVFHKTDEINSLKGDVYGVSTAPQPMIPNRQPTLAHHFDVIDLYLRGRRSNAGGFLPPELEKDPAKGRVAAKQLLLQQKKEEEE